MMIPNDRRRFFRPGGAAHDGLCPVGPLEADAEMRDPGLDKELERSGGATSGL